MARTVLLIEPDPEDAALVMRCLTGAKLADEVVVVGSGSEALEYLSGCQMRADDHTMPSVVMVDPHSLRAEGTSVLVQLRADCRARRIPVMPRVRRGK